MKSAIEKIKNKIKNIVPIDNTAFSFFANDVSFCEEFLRVILEDEKLKVIEHHLQKLIPNIYFKTVILDMLCMLGDGRIVNVEIQLYEEIGHAKRIFQYASMIKQVILDKGEKYKNVKDIVVIYLIDRDIFKKGSTVYNVEMNVVSDKGERVEKWEPGLIVKYVNTEGLTNRKIYEYLKLLKDKTTLSANYKEVSRIKKEVYESGGEFMSKWFQELLEEEINKGIQQGILQGREEGILQGKEEILNSLVMSGVITKEQANKQLSLIK